MQAREVQQFATLLGYGADAICPYLAYEAIFALQVGAVGGGGGGARRGQGTGGAAAAPHRWACGPSWHVSRRLECYKANACV